MCLCVSTVTGASTVLASGWGLPSPKLTRSPISTPLVAGLVFIGPLLGFPSSFRVGIGSRAENLQNDPQIYASRVPEALDREPLES